MTQSLFELEQKTDFIRRHIGPGEEDLRTLLAVVGAESLDDLIEQTVPAAIRRPGPLGIGASMTEVEALAKLKGYAAQNKVAKSYIGMGYHDTHVPHVILRNVLENPGWYTAYTPYQPELAQGRLEALLNFQQLTLDLTGMDLASASLLDEATAAAEAMALAKRMAKSKSNLFFVADDVHPQVLDVVKERAVHFGFDVAVGPAAQACAEEVFGALFQYPTTTGEVKDLRALIAAVQAQKGLACVSADLPVAAQIPGRAGGRRGAGLGPALWRAHGLRWPARRLLRHSRCLQALHAGPHHRCLQGCPWQGRPAHGDADPRAAHPPREGQLQHLYRSGAATWRASTPSTTARWG